MEKEAMGRFVPCICNVENTYMPAISVVRDDSGPELEALIETVRVDYKTQDPMAAYQQAVEDYEDALSKCGPITDWQPRMQCVVSTLKEKGYVLTPKTIKNLMFDTAVPGVIH